MIQRCTIGHGVCKMKLFHENTALQTAVEVGLCDVTFSGSTLFHRYRFYENSHVLVDASKVNCEDLVQLC